MIPVIDAHLHFWDLGRNRYPWLNGGRTVAHRYGDYSAIKHDYLPPDYLRDTAGYAIAASVYVDAEWDPADPLGETRYVTGLAERYGLPGAIVAQAWLDAPDAADLLAAHAGYPLVRSVRHKPGGPAAPDRVGAERTLMSDDRWRAGYAALARHGLHFDLQTPWWNLPEAARLARDVPDVLLIVNHTGVPGGRDAATLEGWHTAMSMLAGLPNVAVKISGLCVPGEAWTVASNAWIVRETVAMFGPGRVMFGSNFPVDGMFAPFRTIFDGFAEIVGDRPEAERREMFYGTALRVYRPRLRGDGDG